MGLEQEHERMNFQSEDGVLLMLLRGKSEVHGDRWCVSGIGIWKDSYLMVSICKVESEVIFVSSQSLLSFPL